ncbi:hypothetical protein BJF85_24575 [Saccharomonospora sp. CUA-673]|nr:hypothetical protein BJF85_24575 [Saccharomonospora sp. CUA-673]
MLVDLRAQLLFLDDGQLLVAARFASLLRGLVLELSEVHEFGYRRPRLRGHLDEVEVRLLGESQRVLDADDATCSPFGPTRRTSGTRMRSLMRVSELMGPPWSKCR